MDWDGDVQILAVSADDPGEVVQALHTVEVLTDWAEIRSAAAESRAHFSPAHRFRLLLVIRRGRGAIHGGMASAGPRPTGQGDLVEVLAEARSRLRTVEWVADCKESSFSRRPSQKEAAGRVFLGIGPRPGALAFLFPGQGSQYVGMLRELACVFPQMHDALAQMNRMATEESSPLSDRIHPPAAFDEECRLAREAALRDTRLAQPAIGAVSLGLLRILEDFGVRADLVGGHSFGELMALRAAGRIEDASLIALAHRRGSLMADCAEQGSGAMLAVFAPIGEVSDLIREDNLDVVIANKNAPRQCVLSGSASEIERSRRVFADHRIATHAVPVSAAFHSRLVAGAEGPFRLALDAVNFRPSTIPVFANETAEPYPDDTESSRDLLARQLARPVEFVAQVEAMYRGGARTFLEVGPHTKLTGLVGLVLEGREHRAIAVDDSLGSAGNIHDLACSLATLAALGYAVDLNRWDEGAFARTITATRPGLTVRISGANARPKERPSQEPERTSGLVMPRPERAGQSSGDVRRPRFSLLEAPDPTMPVPQTRPYAENHRTMNPPERIPLHHANGQASSHALHTPQVLEEVAPLVRARAPVQDDPGPTGLALAFLAAQENLASLQRLAERTADLHRQFLEGQERTQQTFLKLLEQQQGSSRTLPPTADAAPLPTAERPRQNSTSSSATISPPGRPGFHSLENSSETKPLVVSTDSATTALIGVVAEKTGYPAEALDLDMQLDADLGIDSIKRVEILSALQERHPDLPAPRPEQLGSFRTLRSIAEFIGRHPAEESTGRRIPLTKDRDGSLDGIHRVKAPSEKLAQTLLETVAEKTGYPAEMLELDMRLDADLGIDSIKRVEILSAFQDRYPGLPSVGPERIGALGTLREIVAFLGDSARPGPCPADSVRTEPRPTGTARTNSRSPDETIVNWLLEAVAEKTGYPVEMLELDMRLDADLGIDSIKRVEIFSAVQDRLPETRAIGPEHTASLQTLRQIAEFLSAPLRRASTHSPTSENGKVHVNGENGRTVPAGSHAVAAEPSRNGHGPPNGQSVALRRLEARPVTMPTLESREALPLPAGGTFWITDDGSALTHALRSRLLDRGYRPQVIPMPSEGVDLPAPDDRLCGLIVLAPSDRRDSMFVSAAFRTIRAAGPALERSGGRGGAALVTVSRLDGKFGFDGLIREINPASGALAGLAKTAEREWPSVHCKAVDLDVAYPSPEKAAAWIVDELMMRGPAEVGLSQSGRVVLEMRPAPHTTASRGRTNRLGRDDLVVITGGARGSPLRSPSPSREHSSLDCSCWAVALRRMP